jgi:hypothetical protein
MEEKTCNAEAEKEGANTRLKMNWKKAPARDRKSRWRIRKAAEWYRRTKMLFQERKKVIG